MTAVETLKRYWGYDGFRPLQREIVESILSGRDTLGLMPTGGGKSITFQVPAMMMEGIAVVVTPLISLMKDQIDNLRRRHIKAVSLHSGLSMKERNIAQEKLMNGGVKFLYVSPERLENEHFMAILRGLPVSLIVVDEAHCISQWGYDFRPSYLNIIRLRKVKPQVPVLALTATATPEVADDICRVLGMEKAARFAMSFARNNISYIVRRADAKIHDVFHILSRTQGSSIVYVRSRKRTVELSDYLNSSGIRAEAYHAGLRPEAKEERQNKWKSGQVRVMVATNAFGMGIDKPDVRVVIHYDLPPSLEEYYQEAGRAGRDGLASYAVLLTAKSDKGVLHRRISEAFPPRDIILKIYERVCNVLNVAVGEGYDTLKEFDIEAFCRLFKYQERQCRAALGILGRAGYMQFLEEADRRSRLMVTCAREELYHMKGLSREAEKVLTALLREYTGLFADYVGFSEETVAMKAGLGGKETYTALLELGRAGVVSYIPRSRMPLIYLPTSREEPKYVIIGKAIYENRRDVMKARIEAMEKYAFGFGTCRENIMMQYFGQNSKTPCGHCDVCRDRRLQERRTKDDGQVADRLLALLEREPRGLDLFAIERKTGLKSEKLADPLNLLIQEGYIRTEGPYFIKN